MSNTISRDVATATGHQAMMRKWWIPWLAAVSVFAFRELRHGNGDLVDGKIVDRLLRSEVDAVVYFTLLLAAPLVVWLGSRKSSLLTRVAGLVALGFASISARFSGPAVRLAFPICSSIVVGTVSLAVSASVGGRFQGLPPAYHDEYSYLFQAETFLAGRISYPSHEAARLFDQMHVLNEGRFASRYFPGTGLWMAPFVAIGHPYWGHWLAGAICAVLVFWIGRELGGDAAGLIAGLFSALSPGMALFSNLLLAHHPTLVGLGFFLLGALRLIRSAAAGWGLVSGTGLAFALLCRPMTAVGVALPIGAYLAWWTVRPAWETADSGIDAKRPPALSPRRRLTALLAMGMPLVAAGIGMFFYDRDITGNGLTTPYSLYTEIYTPRHVYGFNNVKRGEKHLGPRVLENYDRWAENLTPALAMKNASRRLSASWTWTLGIIPLTLALAGGLVLWRRLPRGAWLILAAIASLHAVHIPYWFVGIEDHHYVFESGPLWGVWTAVVTVAAAAAWRAAGQGAVCWWWGMLLAAAVIMNFEVSRILTLDRSGRDPNWSAPLERAVNDVAFARRRHGRFLGLVAQRAHPLPALVLVEADPSDRHIDYVINNPDLSGPVLIGHFRPDSVPLAEVRRLFPDRSLFLYRAREDDWRRMIGVEKTE